MAIREHDEEVGPMPKVAGFHHVSLSVTDLARSVEWYRSALGLEVEDEFDGDGFRRARLRAPAGRMTLTLTEHRSGAGDRFDERRTGLDHLAFDVGDPEAVQEFAHRFERLGIDHSEVKRTPRGASMVTVRDPDNIQLEVFGLPAGEA